VNAINDAVTRAREAVDHFVNGALLGQPLGAHRLAILEAAVRQQALADAVRAVEGCNAYMAICQRTSKQGQPIVEMKYHDPKRHSVDAKCLWLPELLAALSKVGVDK
jgi:hypothetical protein